LILHHISTFQIPFEVKFSKTYVHHMGARCIVVVKALSYKPESCGFKILSGDEFFSVYQILLAALGPGVHSASNKKHQKQKNNVSGE
jgi:hypothetical protein